MYLGGRLVGPLDVDGEDADEAEALDVDGAAELGGLGILKSQNNLVFKSKTRPVWTRLL